MKVYQRLSLILIAALGLTYLALRPEENSALPLVAIANYGPHSSLQSTIVGLQQGLLKQGFIENKNVRYMIADVNFDLALIPHLISQLKSQKPQVLVVVGTPIAQYAKGSTHDIPLVYIDVTDPVSSGLLKEKNEPDQNMTGSSDQQDLKLLLHFAHHLIPKAKKVGLLYATSEANDKALVEMMEQAAQEENLEVISVPIDQPRDVPLRMQAFNHQVDFIYVGSSGAIQPTLPAIAAEADKMGIPVFNVEEDAVKKGMVLASFGVDYQQVGVNAAQLVSQILKGAHLSQVKPVYPSTQDHHFYINPEKKALLEQKAESSHNLSQP